MTEKFDQLAAEEPIFGELRNVMDLCIVAAVIDQHDLTAQAGCSLPLLTGSNGDLMTEHWFAPKTVPPECSFLKTRSGWIVTASGGVQIESFRFASRVGPTMPSARSATVPVPRTEPSGGGISFRRKVLGDHLVELVRRADGGDVRAKLPRAASALCVAAGVFRASAWSLSRHRTARRSSRSAAADNARCASGDGSGGTAFAAQCRLDLLKQPRSAQRRPTNHHPVDLITAQALHDFLGRIEIAVANQRDVLQSAP